MKIAILNDYGRRALSSADWSAVQARCRVEVFERALAVPDEAAAVLAGFEILCLMRERMPMPAALIERLPALRFIVSTGSVNRSLDLAAATARGIPVATTRGGAGASATPELAWALALNLLRGIPAADRSMREGGWEVTAGRGLKGLTLGVLGLGRLGRVVARYGQAFGMEVIAWSQNLTAEAAEAAGVRRVEKAALFRTADVISIHLVLSERTRGLVGAAELGLMKPDAVLVNTSRGPIVDEAALVAALAQRRIGGAGLDVFDQEPLPADHPLRRLPNTVLTPHLGYSVADAYRAFHEGTVANILAFLDGQPINIMNPEVLVDGRR